MVLVTGLLGFGADDLYGMTRLADPHQQSTDFSDLRRFFAGGTDQPADLGQGAMVAMSGRSVPRGTLTPQRGSA